MPRSVYRIDREQEWCREGNAIPFLSDMIRSPPCKRGASL